MTDSETRLDTGQVCGSRNLKHLDNCNIRAGNCDADTREMETFAQKIRSSAQLKSMFRNPRSRCSMWSLCSCSSYWGLGIIGKPFYLTTWFVGVGCIHVWVNWAKKLSLYTCSQLKQTKQLDKTPKMRSQALWWTVALLLAGYLGILVVFVWQFCLLSGFWVQIFKISSIIS